MTDVVQMQHIFNFQQI